MNPDIQTQTDYYNNRWRDFDFANHFSQTRCLFILRAILETGLIKPRICDLGCGAGWLPGVLSAFAPCIGVELSGVAVNQARDRYPNAQFVCADVLRWTWEGDPFDIVVSQEVIEHIPGDQGAYVDVAYRVLRPGGYLVLTTPNPDVLKAIPAAKRGVYLDQPIEKWLTRGELTALLERRGFRVVSVSSLVLGLGELGGHRLANSHRLQVLLRSLGLRRPWEALLSKLGFGMYQALTARKMP